MIRINPRLYFQCLGKEYIFWGPTIYSLSVGRGESAVARRYDEKTYIRLDLQQKTKPVYTGYTDYPSKHYWWYKDQILVCDEKFNAKVIKGWHVKQEALKARRLQKYKELAESSSRTTSKRKSDQKKVNRTALDAVQALMALGYKKSHVIKIVDTVRDKTSGLSTENIVKQALKYMK